MAVTFVQVVPGTRKIEFDVSGKKVTRRLPKQFSGTVDQMIIALGRGLAIEESSGILVADNSTSISSKMTPIAVEANLTLAPNTIVVADPTPVI